MSVSSWDPMTFRFRSVSFDPVGYWADFVKLTQPFDKFWYALPRPQKSQKSKSEKNGKLRIWQELLKGYFTKNLGCVWRPHAISFSLRLLWSCWILGRFCKIDTAFWPILIFPTLAPILNATYYIYYVYYMYIIYIYNIM